MIYYNSRYFFQVSKKSKIGKIYIIVGQALLKLLTSHFEKISFEVISGHQRTKIPEIAMNSEIRIFSKRRQIIRYEKT